MLIICWKDYGEHAHAIMAVVSKLDHSKSRSVKYDCATPLKGARALEKWLAQGLGKR